MSKIQIVQFQNGKYGVRRKSWDWLLLEFDLEFLVERNGYSIWVHCEYPSAADTLNTVEDAKRLLQSHIERKKHLERLAKDVGGVIENV